MQVQYKPDKRQSNFDTRQLKKLNQKLKAASVNPKKLLRIKCTEKKLAKHRKLGGIEAENTPFNVQ
eukprot:3272725-Rhodomonas_salina.1